MSKIRQAMTEQWRPVVGWEGYYEVSNLGQIRTVPRIVRMGTGWRRIPQRIRKQATVPEGYKVITLSGGGRQTTVHVHQLVLETFVAPRPPGMQACHGDGDPANNTIGNLRWDTESENARDRIRHGRHNHADKTECKNGHEFTPENTYVRSSRTRPGRNCRACAREHRQRRKRERSERSGEVVAKAIPA